MEKQEIIEMQKKIGTTPDGWWGPKSIAALKKYLRGLAPKNNPWPESDQVSLRKFYGTPGDESNLTNINVSHLPISYEGKKVNTIRCHKKVAESLYRILNNIFSKYKGKENILEEAKDYGGCFNFRLKRGGNTYSVHCLPKNAPVWTPEGVKNIQDIKEGDEVFSFDKGHLVVKKVKNSWENGLKPIVTVNINGGKIECSPEHQILTLVKKTLPVDQWVRNQDKNGHKRAEYSLEMKQAKDLKHGDKIIYLQKETEKTQKEDDWFEILGLFIGDGCIHHRNGEPSHISFQIPKQDRIRHRAEEVLKGYFGEENLKFDDKQILSYRPVVFNRFLGYDKKSYEKTIPQEIWNAEKHQQLSFLRGYVYSDGTVLNSKSKGLDRFTSRYSFKCASLKLMNELRLLLSLFGFRNTRMLEIPPDEKIIERVKCKTKKSWNFQSVDVFNILNVDHDDLYKERNQKSSSHNKGDCKCMGNHLLFPDFIYKSVKNVEFGQEQEVFDIEVEDTHNFIVDGLVVSNSWGAAIDLDADDNTFKDSWPMKADMPLEIIEEFTKEGWTSAAVFWGYDAMHMQACKIPED